MAIVANTFTTYSVIGAREELMDAIYNISPTDFPCLTGFGKGKIKNTLFEWQTDVLAAAAANAQLEGDDVASFTAVVPTVRLNNRAQISRKTVIVSGTEDIINKAGRNRELAYQIDKLGAELKRDMEFAITQNTTAVAGNSTTARQTRGLEGYAGGTNVSLGATGAAAASASNTAPTDGTARVFTEAMLKDVLKQAFSSGGNPDVLMVGPFNKQVVSGFTGNSTRMDKGEDKALTASISVYKSDFGDIKIVPNRFQRERTAFVLEMDKFSVMYYRPFQVVELAKTGDAEKRMLITEFGLKSDQEAASGAIRDLTTA